MPIPKLIILNGFAGAGKSTIAKRYINDNPLALMIEADELIVNMGQWLTHEDTARELVYAHIQSLIAVHLSRGHDVVLPYLVVDASNIECFNQIAAKNNAAFYTFYLSNDKETAIGRLLERGTWGEAGTDPLGDQDMPVIDDIYSRMETQLASQKESIAIDQKERSVDETYSLILSHII